MTTKLERPAQLDNTKLYTRAEYRQWQNAMFDYQAAIDEEAREQERKAAQAEQGQAMTEEDYDAMAIKRYDEQVARQAAREAEQERIAAEKAAYLESMPDVAVVTEHNPYNFIKAIQHWTRLGYELNESASIDVLPTYFAVTLDKPATKAAK